jgi:hypothetical protein
LGSRPPLGAHRIETKLAGIAGYFFSSTPFLLVTEEMKPLAISTFVVSEIRTMKRSSLTLVTTP